MLTPEQRAELHRRARERVIAPALRDRLELVRLSDLGWGVPRIARYLGRHEQAVRKYVAAFLRQGFAALPDRPRPGRPPTLTAAHQRALERLLAEAATRGDRTWSTPQLTRWLAATQGVRVTPKYLSGWLKARRLRWKRTKRSVQHKADPALQARAKADLAALQR